MKNKISNFMKKVIVETNKITLFIVGVMTISSIVIGLLYGFGYFMAVVAFCFIFMFFKKIEKDDSKIMEQKRKKEENEVRFEQIEEEIERLEKKAEIIKEHIEQTNDLDSKLRLAEIEEEIEQWKEEKNNG